MRKISGQLIYSPADLTHFIACKHLTTLEKEALESLRKKPAHTDTFGQALQEQVLDFERQLLQKSEEEGKKVRSISQDDPLAAEKTLAAMREGVDLIYQGQLGKAGEWQGRPDFLMKVDKPSALGSFSYEVLATQWAMGNRAATLIHLCMYADALVELQGLLPELIWVKTEQHATSYRVDAYMSYVRYVKKRFLDAVQSAAPATYPEPVPHCDVCTWWEVCNEQRRRDDHLSIVAGMRKMEMKELKANGVETLKQLAYVHFTANFRIATGTMQLYEKLRDQAKVQWRSRQSGNRLLYVLLKVQPDQGFRKLPEPHAHDVYLELRGNPLVEPDGLEYLFGGYYQGCYQGEWARNEPEEKQLFEEWIDRVVEIKVAHPGMHIYHYTPHATRALKRLASKYSSRREELDGLLRAGTFVDLDVVVRQALQASVENYTLKELEKFFGYEREIGFREVAKLTSSYALLLETGKAGEADPDMLAAIKWYHEDDCRTLAALHTWLEKLRLKAIEQGIAIPRPEAHPLKASQERAEFLERIQPIFEQLMQGVPAVPSERTPEQQGRYLLAHMLDWYRREKMSKWWDVLRLKALSDEQLLDERAALAFVQHIGHWFEDSNTLMHSYRISKQEFDRSLGMNILTLGEKFPGTVWRIAILWGILQMGKRPDSIQEEHPTRLIFYKDEAQQLTKEEALIRLAEWVVQHGLEHPDSRYRAVRSLLLGAEPQITEALRPQQDTLALAKEWARKLHNSYLLIQGAPGSGKSYMASRMIVDLIKQGKKVGITARSYGVLMNLLEQIWALRKQEGLSFRVSQKVKDATSSQKWETFHQLKQLTEHLHTSQLIVGFPLLFANLEADQQLDYLFIDDAGQLSLVDVLTYGLSAKNVVLIGDPQHAQPSREVHPAGTEVSALAHVQQGRQTIQADRGIFLASTYRMHPDIWAFDSEQFYARQLQADPGLEPRQLTGRSRWQGSGIRFVPVRHQGNTNVSEEEVDTIRVIVQELMGFGVRQSDSSGEVSGIGFRDIQIIAPYSEQARLLKQALERFFVGTVDDIPDEEAAVVIYSMTSSSPEGAPSGMEFLYNANRFHLALSRAKILFILVGSPAAFEPRCKSPAQLKLVNPFCRFLEVVEGGSFKRA